MNKLITLLILVALTLPVSTLAQPDPDRGPRDREDGPPMRDRTDRERGDRERQRDGDDEDRSDRRREAISVEQLEQAIATVREMHPEAKMPWLDHIEQLAKDDPEEAAERLSRYPRLRDLMESRKKRPAEFELQSKQSKLMREVFPLLREIREAKEQEDQAKIDELRPQLRERIEALFQIRLQMKELEIQRLRKKLKDAEIELAGIKADSDTLVDEKMQELMTKGGPRGRRDEGDRPSRPDRGERPEDGGRPNKPDNGR